MKKIQYIISIAIVSFPLLTFAEGKTLHNLVVLLAGYMNDALGLLMGLAVLMFVWFVVRYFIMHSDDTKRAEAAQYVMWALIGFFVILSLWGLVNILISTFELDQGNPTSWANMKNLFPQ